MLDLFKLRTVACLRGRLEEVAQLCTIRHVDVVVHQERVVVGRRRITIIEEGRVYTCIRVGRNENIAHLRKGIHTCNIVNGHSLKRKQLELKICDSAVNLLIDIKIFDSTQRVDTRRLHRLQVAQSIPLGDIPNVVRNIKSIDRTPEDVTVGLLIGERVAVVKTEGVRSPAVDRLVVAETGAIALEVSILNNPFVLEIRNGTVVIAVFAATRNRQVLISTHTGAEYLILVIIARYRHFL